MLVNTGFTVSSSLVLSRKWVSGLPFQLSPYNAITRGMSSKVCEWGQRPFISQSPQGKGELPPHSLILPLSYNFMLMSSALLNTLFLNIFYSSEPFTHAYVLCWVNAFLRMLCHISGTPQEIYIYKSRCGNHNNLSRLKINESHTNGLTRYNYLWMK